MPEVTIVTVNCQGSYCSLNFAKFAFSPCVSCMCVNVATAFHHCNTCAITSPAANYLISCSLKALVSHHLLLDYSPCFKWYYFLSCFVSLCELISLVLFFKLLAILVWNASASHDCHSQPLTALSHLFRSHSSQFSSQAKLNYIHCWVEVKGLILKPGKSPVSFPAHFENYVWGGLSVSQRHVMSWDENVLYRLGIGS